MLEVVRADIVTAPSEYAEEVNAELRQLLGEEIAESLDYETVNGIHLAVADPMHDDVPKLRDILTSESPLTTSPLLRILPFANGFERRRGNQPVQMQALANLTGRPIIGFAPPAKGSRLPLESVDRLQVSNGDFSPVSDSYLNALDIYTTRRYGHRAKVQEADIVGASLGATIGLNLAARADLAERLDVGEVHAISPPTVLERSVRKLFSDFGKAGAGELQERLLSTGLPSLVDAVGLSLQHKDRLPLGFVLDTLLEMTSHPLQNMAIAKGMGHTEGTWRYDIPAALQSGTNITIVSEGRGAIAPPQAVNDRYEQFRDLFDKKSSLHSSETGRIALLSIVDGDHTQGDHFPTLASIIKGDFVQVGDKVA